MTFTDDQKRALAAPLNRVHVKTREQGGRSLSYIEGWTVIDQANLIFGFDGWDRETIFMQCITDAEREVGRDKLPGFGVTYICKVKVSVGSVVREGTGSGHGIDRDRGLAHESAAKEAETDAMKRAFMTFGNPFGLALYDKTQTNVADDAVIKRQAFIEACKETIDEMLPDKLLTWWNSDAQKTARRRYDLKAGEVDLLKARVISRLPAKGSADAA